MYFENYRRVRTPLPFPLHAAGSALAYNTCKYFMVFGYLTYVCEMIKHFHKGVLRIVRLTSSNMAALIFQREENFSFSLLTPAC